jgi:hypothetical protein
MVPLWLLWGLSAIVGGEEQEKEPPHYKWAVTGYFGALAQSTIGDVFDFSATFEEESYIGVLALSREFWRFRNLFGFEVEGQIGKHFNEMHHWEFNLLVAGRWHYFPWDKYVETSLAVGTGLSYATDIPEIELEDDEEAQRLLNYLLFEFTFGAPQLPRWDLVVRVHHRSGVFGLFGGVHGGANFVCGGIKYKF